jgi:hypothetical protein
MEPTIPAGAIVTVVHDGRPRPGAVSAFVGEDGRLVVHRFRRLTPQGYVFRGDANAVDDAAVPIDRYVGRVTSARDGDRVAHFGPGDRATARVRHRLLAVRSALGRQRRRLSKYLSRSSDPPAQRPQ